MAELDNNEAPQKQTTVEEGTQFRGTLQSSCQVVVRGLVEGELTAPSVVISESGSVVGHVTAQTIRSEGELAGHVDADEVFLSGSVRNDTVIRAKTLEVKLSGGDKKLELKFGECGRGGRPTRTREHQERLRRSPRRASAGRPCRQACGRATRMSR
jgi:cytoskeletal protein CcmA (bactofilin family)